MSTLKSLLGTEGIHVLMQTGHLTRVGDTEIEECSKADVFDRTLEILWFALQVIGRLIGALSVTPIETHMVIHVGCTILVYAIWFNKKPDSEY